MEDTVKYAVNVRIRTASRVTVVRRIIVTATGEGEAVKDAMEYITNEYPTARRVTAQNVEVLG